MLKWVIDMLTAKQNNQLIDLTQIPTADLPQLKQLSNYQCPHCGAPVIFKQGPKRKAHFSHLSSCDYEGHTHESEAHHLSKLVLSQWLMMQGALSVQLEYQFESIPRIADIYFEYQGQKYVLEIQKSMITSELFETRTGDYHKIGIQVFWIFIGDIQIRSKTYILNQVMRLQKDSRLIHFNVMSETVTFFDHLVWLNQKEIEGTVQEIPLKLLSIGQLVLPTTVYKQKQIEDWLDIKKEFRCKKYASYQRSERLLLRMCAPFLINLSLLPSVVGWPITGEAYEKPLFIWQAYVVLCIMSSYEERDVFTLSEIRQKLKLHYHLKESKQAYVALKKYLELLSFFGMINEQFGYYEYIKRPRLYLQLEPYLVEDKHLGQIWLQQKN